MAGAGAGSAGHSVALKGEKLWRLIDPIWHQPDVNGQLVVEEAAFIGEISFLRVGLVTDKHVDAVTDKNSGAQKFAKFGIAELEADEIVAATKGGFRITQEPDWPTDSHVIFIRQTGGKNLSPKHPEVSDLTDLTNANPLRRNPTP